MERVCLLIPHLRSRSAGEGAEGKDARDYSVRDLVLRLSTLSLIGSQYSRTHHIRPSRDWAVVGTPNKLDSQRGEKMSLKINTTSVLVEKHA